MHSTALQGEPGADSKRRPACYIQKAAMSDIPPPPSNPLIIELEHFPSALNSEGFPTAVAKANLGKLIRLGS